MHAEHRSLKNSLDVFLIESAEEKARWFRKHLQAVPQETSLRWKQELGPALRGLRETQPALLFIDPVLPGREPDSVIRRCVEIDPPVPVVVLTDEENLRGGDRALEIGATDYIRTEDLSPSLLNRTLRWASFAKSDQGSTKWGDSWIQSVAENVEGGLYRSEPDQGIQHANEAFLSMFGYDSLKALQTASAKALYADPSRRNELVERVRETGVLDGIEVRFQRKNGDTFVGLVNARSVRGPDGTVEYIDGVVTDITDRKRREETLRRQKSLLEQTQRLAGAWEADLRTGEVDWTEEVYRIHELEPGSEIGFEDAFEFPVPAARSRLRESIDRCVEKKMSYDQEVPITTAKGNRRWIRTVGAPSELEEGEVVKIAGALQDITDRKRAEQALQEQKKSLARYYQ